MFNELERNIIIMALMYFKNDFTEDDLDDLNGEPRQKSFPASFMVERIIENLIEDLVGPTWDEETTTENIKRETAKRTRRVE